MLTAEELADLEAKHVRTAHLIGKGGAWEVVFRKPTRAEYKAFRARAHNPAQAADAQEILARACVVHPSKEAFDALLEDYPGIPEAASKEFTNLVGLSVEDS